MKNRREFLKKLAGMTATLMVPVQGYPKGKKILKDRIGGDKERHGEKRLRSFHDRHYKSCVSEKTVALLFRSLPQLLR